MNYLIRLNEAESFFPFFRKLEQSFFCHSRLYLILFQMVVAKRQDSALFENAVEFHKDFFLVRLSRSDLLHNLKTLFIT
jgi:hypothetical protein